MARCARCSVASLMLREQVVEIEIRSSVKGADSKYGIYVIRDNQPVWSMTIYSIRHSMDEDCSGSESVGFPRKITSGELMNYTPIIEWPNGKLENVPVESIEFCEPE